MIYLPSEYKEIIVDVETTSGISMTMHFCKEQLTSDWKQYRSGWYYNSAYYSEFIIIIALHIVLLNTFWIDGENHGESSTTTVYYR